MCSTPYPVVCLSVGTKFDDVYIARMQNMLERHMPKPFQLHCFSDRSRQAPAQVEFHDCRDWQALQDKGIATRQKLRLLDPETMPWDEFLYLDLSLVIRQSLKPMLEFADACPAPIIAARDWFYRCCNTSVMRIRPGVTTRAVFDAYIEGREYPFRVAGDQDFLYAAAADLGISDQLANWPDGMVMSYKYARRHLGLTTGRARRLVNEAIILKFHGFPKMDQLPSWRDLPQVLWENPHRVRRTYFATSDVRAHWR